MKLQDQPLASQLVVNALMDKFANINNIYESYRLNIKSAVPLPKADSENQQTKRRLLSFLVDILNGLQAQLPQEMHGKLSSM